MIQGVPLVHRHADSGSEWKKKKKHGKTVKNPHKFESVLCKSQVFNVHGSVHCKKILIYIQQDATLHSLFYLETDVHVLGGTTTHHQDCK